MPESSTTDPRGALRKATTDKGIVFQTLISWMPPSIELPTKTQGVLMVLECQQKRIIYGWYDAIRKVFFLSVPDNTHIRDRDAIHPRNVRFWAPATIDQL